AGSQTQTLRRSTPEKERMKTAAEMTGPQPRRAVEKWKAKTSLPTFPLPVLYSIDGFEHQNKEA
ncbi:MAG: hypothetical protein ACRD4O_01110, partial [Bryobacteraceae bacterium]